MNLSIAAYGTVFLVRKKGGVDDGNLYAMKVLKKMNIVQKVKTAEHTKTERQVTWFYFEKLVCRLLCIHMMHLLMIIIICDRRFCWFMQVLEAIGRSPFLVGMHYAFQTDSKLYLILGT